VDCPKCKKTALLDAPLTGGITVQRCSECQGQWVAAMAYQAWQQHHPLQNATPETLAQPIVSEFNVPEVDARAGLCPSCSRYLSRTKIDCRTPFYLERCNECEGYWCDRGEWDVLTQLGVSGSLEQFFEREWQMKIREQAAAANERQGMIEKLGDDLAQHIFDLADTLNHHEHGDFALAYLIRKAAQNQDIRNMSVKKAYDI
jgi:Zn-finger nucleic acid-binding protein